MISGIYAKTLPKFAARLLLFVLLCHPAVSRAAEGPQDLAALLSALRQDSPARVDFTESRTMAFLTAPVVLEGQLSYRPGGRLERRVTRPKPETMAIDGGLLMIEQGGNDPPVRVMLADYPPLQAFVEALRALLAGDRAALEKSFDSDFKADGANWQLTLTPKTDSLATAVERIDVAGTADRIAAIEIEESNGNSTLVELHPPS